jgi:hypothetical protein
MQSEAGLHAARLLSPDADWQLISAVLCDFYASGQPLTIESFPHMKGLFAELDTDASGRLKTSELAELAHRKAHLAVRAGFAAASTPDAHANLQIMETPDEIVRVLKASPDRIAMAIGDESIDISIHDRSGINDMSPNSPREPATTREQLWISAHNRGDSVFAHLDADRDGRLGEREIAHAPARLHSLDRDGDDRLGSGEVAGRMTVAIVRGRLPAGEARYHLAQGAPQLDETSRPPEWFVHGDFNGDGDISRREFVGTLEQFGQLDLNEDGFISAPEAAVVEVH